MIIIDDGSSDGTNKVAFEYVKRHTVENVRVILLGRNHGKGEAIRKVSQSLHVFIFYFAHSEKSLLIWKMKVLISYNLLKTVASAKTL